MANETSQVNVNQIRERGDAPALESQENRGAPAPSGGQAGQDYVQDYKRIKIRRGDIYVWDGRKGRKYKLSKESNVVVEVRSRKGVVLEYDGRYASFITVANIVEIDMGRNYIDVRINNNEHVDDDRIILRSYDEGKFDEITQGYVLAVMARFNIDISIRWSYLEYYCDDCNAYVSIEEARNARELGFYTVVKHVKTRII